MTADALTPFRWLHREADRIREEAGRDAEKFEALLDDPALAQEALIRFPSYPLLHSMLQECLYYERLMVRRGFFVGLDGPPTQEELSRRHDEYEAKWAHKLEEAK